MSSWIARLLSIAAAFALSLLTVVIFLPVHGHPAWTNVPSQLHRLRTDVEWAEIGEPPLTTDEIESWLSGRASKGVADRFAADPEKDPWRHPYRVTAVAGEGPDRFGFYSTGRDGISNSNGNDPDDINSWTEAKTLYYERQGMAFWLLIAVGLSAVLTPFVYTLAGMLCSFIAAIFGLWARDEVLA